jgi:hypothetical protein
VCVREKRKDPRNGFWNVRKQHVREEEEEKGEK